MYRANNTFYHLEPMGFHTYIFNEFVTVRKKLINK